VLKTITSFFGMSALQIWNSGDPSYRSILFIQNFKCSLCSPEYTAAIERKQVEQQIAERQRFVVEKAKQEKMATVIRIEGETEAGRLISEAMKISPEFLELRKIEASKVFSSPMAASHPHTFSNNVFSENCGIFGVQPKCSICPWWWSQSSVEHPPSINHFSHTFVRSIDMIQFIFLHILEIHNGLI
jgi:hypothetical protein